MQGVIIIGEVTNGRLYIEAVEFPDGSRRRSNFSIYEGEKWVQGYTAECYTIYFGETDTEAKLYHLRQKGLWFLEE